MPASLSADCLLFQATKRLVFSLSPAPSFFFFSKGAQFLRKTLASLSTTWISEFIQMMIHLSLSISASCTFSVTTPPSQRCHQTCFLDLLSPSPFPPPPTAEILSRHCFCNLSYSATNNQRIISFFFYRTVANVFARQAGAIAEHGSYLGKASKDIPLR